LELPCTTRLLKNARFLQSSQVGFFPKLEPLDGFPSLISPELLCRLERTPAENIRIEGLAEAISKNRPPKAGTKLASPLFSGTLRFVQATFSSGGTDYSIPADDLNTAMQFAILAVIPISAYASQYGPNRLTVAGGTIPLRVSISGGKYNDQILAGWVDQLAKSNGYGADSCLVFLNPLGVVNTDGDATQGVLGYHYVSPSGVPYAFVNVTGHGLTVGDEKDIYAVALSHEIAEMTVDPKADGSNPEVSDPCAGNCQVDYRNYFDSGGTWLGPSAKPGYQFFIDGIAKPTSAASCPAPESSCSYPPPNAGSGS
jgi:hypothetical protein